MMRTLKILILSGVILSSLGAPLSVAHAAVGLDPNLYPDGLPTASGMRPSTSQTAEADATMQAIRVALTNRFVNVILGIAGTVALYFMLNNGFWLITSAGGEKVEEAKKGLTWACVGLLLIILSYSIIRFVISIPLSAEQRPPETTQSK